MSVPIGAMIGVSSKIAEYFGLIEGVNTLITRLLHQAFNSAKSNLEYARNARGQAQIDYIKQARIEFNQAVAVEENENKLLALVGLSMCQYLLGDEYNSRKTLNMINDVELTRAEKTKYFVLGYVGHLTGAPLRIRKLEFKMQKERALIVNKKLLR